MKRVEDMYRDPPTGGLETLTGGFWTPVVTRKHLLEGPGIYIYMLMQLKASRWTTKEKKALRSKSSRVGGSQADHLSEACCRRSGDWPLHTSCCTVVHPL